MPNADELKNDPVPRPAKSNVLPPSDYDRAIEVAIFSAAIISVLRWKSGVRFHITALTLGVFALIL